MSCGGGYSGEGDIIGRKIPWEADTMGMRYLWAGGTWGSGVNLGKEIPW